MAKTKIIKSVNFFNKKFLDKQLKKFKISKDSFQRINLHKSEDDLMHIMIMFYKKKFDYPPHFSVNKTESFFVIKGKFKILFYHKNKKISKKIILEKDNILGYKLNKNIYHKIVPLTNYCVALEILDGPYIKNSVKKINE